MTMPMTITVSLMDLIVLLAGVFAVVFLVAWIVSPRLRVWIERPKYRFLADVQTADMQTYDQSQDHEAKHSPTR
jgi:uncharacterized protein HemY